MSKRWVYTELVKDKDDTLGFLAYSLYKYDKNEFAERLRSQDTTEKKISEELKTFHRQTVESLGRINGYREKAELLINDIMDQLDNQIRQDYEVQLEGANEQANEIENLNSEMQLIKANHEHELRKAREEAVLTFHRAVEITQVRERGRILRSLTWQWNGFAGVFAAVIFAALVYGISVLLLPQQSRDDIVNGAINNIRDTLYQPPTTQKNNIVGGENNLQLPLVADN